MSPLDLTEQAQELRNLAHEFEALRDRVRGVSYTPGTDALRQTGPLLLTTQDLTATLLVRLGALANSPYTRIPGSHASLECLSSLVLATTLAGNDLARALHANPLEGAAFPGYPAYSESDRVARHATAIPRMTGHLTDAAHQLDLSATGCHYVATGITSDLADAHDQTTPERQTTGPALSPAQYDALKTLSAGEGKLYESPRRGLGVTRVVTHDGTRVSIATYRALAKRELVTADTSTSLFHGQKITVTEKGQRAQAQHRPHPVTPPAVTPPVPDDRPPRALLGGGVHPADPHRSHRRRHPDPAPTARRPPPHRADPAHRSRPHRDRPPEPLGGRRRERHPHLTRPALPPAARPR
ncbi:hypothetical protein [Streptomyces niveus]|uniref:hypothetical protein n=1 Tax=Streptomyces niveus TaxID=193462 RepID=UPI0035E21E3B